MSYIDEKIYKITFISTNLSFWFLILVVNISFFLKKFYFFILERGREGEKEGEKHQCTRETLIGCLSYAPSQGPGPQSRHVPWLGIELAIFRFAGQCPTHWATPVRAVVNFSTAWKTCLLNLSNKNERY